jgi:hypothetical protein
MAEADRPWTRRSHRSSGYQSGALSQKKQRGESAEGEQAKEAGLKPEASEKDAQPEQVLNNLYKHTPMQTTFGAIMLALADGVPKVMNLKELLQRFVDHRHQVITRRTQFDLTKAEEREHILEGLKRIDEANSPPMRPAGGSGPTVVPFSPPAPQFCPDVSQAMHGERSGRSGTTTQSQAIRAARLMAPRFGARSTRTSSARWDFWTCS